MNTASQITFQDLLFFELAPAVVERFVNFHKSNPHIYRVFKVYAEAARLRGVKRIGAKAIFETIRYETSLETINSAFKVNNSFVSCYVRLLILEEPSFKDLFETRKTPGTLEVL